MPKLIDRDALKIAIDNGWQPDMMVSEIWDIIDEQPIVDAVPVVRCKDCEHYDKRLGYFCPMVEDEPNQDDHCFYGRKRDG